jgi:hypothetical protein
MTLDKAKQLAIELMTEHGLIDKRWSFKFDQAKRRYGCCMHSRRIISLSSPLTQIRKDDKVRNTILHEIAHALVGGGHGHDDVWRSKALEIGCNGQRCSNDVSIKGNWVGECPNGHVYYKHRISKAQKSCGICYPSKFNEKYLITFKKKKHEPSIVLS